MVESKYRSHSTIFPAASAGRITSRTCCERAASISSELAALNRENRDIMHEQRDLVAKSYLAGETGITRLNEAQNNFVAAEEEYVQSLVNLSKARAQLAAAVGGVHSIQ